MEPSPYPPFPVLTTPRLVLRELTLDDAPFWLRNFSDPEVVELTAFEAPADLEAARAELLEYGILPWRRQTGIRWGVALRPSSELVGTCGYHRWDKANRNARMGYELGKEHRRKGIMSEALAGAIDFGFTSMGLHRIEVLADPRNAGSRRLVEKLGFHQEGQLREDTLFRGRFVDDVVYSLLEGERPR